MRNLIHRVYCGIVSIVTKDTYIQVGARKRPAWLAVLLFGVLTHVAAAATIDAFTPNRGLVGTAITIRGTGFSEDASRNVVRFSNYAIAGISSASATELVVAVPSGATTGPINVGVDGGPVSYSATDFTIVPQITVIAPSFAPIGTLVTISGEGFALTPSANAVTFNGVAATVATATATQLTVTVPAGASTGPMRVTVGGQTVQSAADFPVTSSITSVTPDHAPVGASVTLTGQNFSPITAGR